MPLVCQHKQFYRRDYCLPDCPALAPDGAFSYHRVESPADLLPPDERIVDVAVMDMNHGWPNLGHDSIVHVLQDTACDLVPQLQPIGLRVRVFSFEVRVRHMIPERPGGRFALYLGSGGPGHIDPHRNDGKGEGSQGIVEDASWEAPLFDLFDRIKADESTALLSVCHSFGMLCRWSGVARPSLRADEKGGKSVGVLENLLTPEARRHPWFRHLADELPDHRRLRVVDHRLFDLVPVSDPLPHGATAIGYETVGVGGPQGDAVTMVEWARDPGGVMPRMFGANHHPEIVDRSRQEMILRQKFEKGEVDREWFEDRMHIMTTTYPDDAADQRLHLTSDYALIGPVRFYVLRQLRLRAEKLGLPFDLHEDRIAAGEEHGAASVSLPSAERA